MSKKITYIIPIHTRDDRLFRAVESVPLESNLIIAAPEGLWESGWIQKYIGEREYTPASSSKDSYQKLVNNAIALTRDDTDYISILEFDDVVTNTANSIIQEYAEAWGEADILAPLSCVVRESEDQPILVSIANETGIAPGIAEEYGIIDFNMMLKSNYLFVNGCYIKPSVFTEFGGFKANFEMFADYEWALRVIYNGCVVRTVPKASRLHYLYDDSMFSDHKNRPRSEVDMWLNSARQEYFFEEDRELNLTTDGK